MTLMYAPTEPIVFKDAHGKYSVFQGSVYLHRGVVTGIMQYLFHPLTGEDASGGMTLTNGIHFAAACLQINYLDYISKAIISNRDANGVPTQYITHADAQSSAITRFIEWTPAHGINVASKGKANNPMLAEDFSEVKFVEAGIKYIKPYSISSRLGSTYAYGTPRWNTIKKSEVEALIGAILHPVYTAQTYFRD